MDPAQQKQLIGAYLEAYNRFDVDGMLASLHEEVVFRNISGGEVTLTTTGKAQFGQQAEQAKHYFTQREQRVTNWKTDGVQVEVAIAYTAVLAVALPNGLKPGDTLQLQGRSAFEFQDDKIISLTDFS